MNKSDKGKIVERRGRPVRKVTIQKEFGDELGIIWRDLLNGFYGDGDDLDLSAIKGDLEHAMYYAEELKEGAPFYPASGDDYVIDRWEKEIRKYNERIRQGSQMCGGLR